MKPARTELALLFDSIRETVAREGSLTLRGAEVDEFQRLTRELFRADVAFDRYTGANTVIVITGDRGNLLYDYQAIAAEAR